MGALDRTRVVMEAPPNSGSLFFNYKKIATIVLLALVDVNYKFIIVNVGAYGRNSDGGIFQNSVLGSALRNGNLKKPGDKALPCADISMPHVIMGDEAFPFSKHLIRPYPGNQTKNNEAKKIFNYRLSRARRVSENAFGVWTQKFHIFHRRIKMSPEHLNKIVLATCALHYYLRDDADPVTTEADSTSSPPIYTVTDLQHIDGNTTDDALAIRDTFKGFFCFSTGCCRLANVCDQKRTLIFCKLFMATEVP
jgi:hypothetical protein